LNFHVNSIAKQYRTFFLCENFSPSGGDGHATYLFFLMVTVSAGGGSSSRSLAIPGGSEQIRFRVVSGGILANWFSGIVNPENVILISVRKAGLEVPSLRWTVTASCFLEYIYKWFNYVYLLWFIEVFRSKLQRDSEKISS
jgi:hypothetical protein